MSEEEDEEKQKLRLTLTGQLHLRGDLLEAILDAAGSEIDLILAEKADLENIINHKGSSLAQKRFLNWVEEKKKSENNTISSSIPQYQQYPPNISACPLPPQQVTEYPQSQYHSEGLLLPPAKRPRFDLDKLLEDLNTSVTENTDISTPYANAKNIADFCIENGEEDLTLPIYCLGKSEDLASFSLACAFAKHYGSKENITEEFVRACVECLWRGTLAYCQEFTFELEREAASSTLGSLLNKYKNSWPSELTNQARQCFYRLDIDVDDIVPGMIIWWDPLDEVGAVSIENKFNQEIKLKFTREQRVGPLWDFDHVHVHLDKTTKPIQLKKITLIEKASRSHGQIISLNHEGNGIIEFRSGEIEFHELHCEREYIKKFKVGQQVEFQQGEFQQGSQHEGQTEPCAVDIRPYEPRYVGTLKEPFRGNYSYITPEDNRISTSTRGIFVHKEQIDVPDLRQLRPGDRLEFSITDPPDFISDEYRPVAARVRKLP